MTDNEKLALVKILIGSTTLADSVVTEYITLAEDEMLEYMGVSSIPDKYARLQCKLASRMILRRGTEGEISHGENGSTSVSRQYGSVDDADILSRLPRVCGVI